VITMDQYEYIRTALNIRALGQRVQALTRGIPCVA